LTKKFKQRFLQNEVMGGSSSSAIAHHLSDGTEPSKFVQDTVQSNSVAIFSKSWCGYCTSTKSTFGKLQQKQPEIKIRVIELDLLPSDDGSLIQNELLRMTNQSTVPNVFINQQHIGGNSDIQELQRSGKLLEMLKKC